MSTLLCALFIEGCVCLHIYIYVYVIVSSVYACIMLFKSYQDAYDPDSRDQGRLR